MSADVLVERLFEALISGDRPLARHIVRTQAEQGVDPELLLTDLYWPTYELIERLYRSDQLTCLSYHMSTRLLRVLVDQTAASLVEREGIGSRGRTIFAVCGPSEADELGAQMAVDLLEASGFTVAFGGGGIPADEVIAQVQQERPDVLLMFCAAPMDLPHARQAIDQLHETGACPGTQIVVGGGVFNRAEGLAEEIGADLWATHPLELVDLLVERETHRAAPDQRTVGRKRRRAA